MNFFAFIWRYLFGQSLDGSAVCCRTAFTGTVLPIRVLAVEAGAAGVVGASAAHAVQVRRWLWPWSDSDWLQNGLVSGSGARPPSGRSTVVSWGNKFAGKVFSQGRFVSRPNCFHC